MRSVRSLVKPAAAKSPTSGWSSETMSKGVPAIAAARSCVSRSANGRIWTSRLSSMSGCSAANFSWAASSNVFQRSSGATRIIRKVTASCATAAPVPIRTMAGTARSKRERRLRPPMAPS